MVFFPNLLRYYQILLTYNMYVEGVQCDNLMYVLQNNYAVFFLWQPKRSSTDIGKCYVEKESKEEGNENPGGVGRGGSEF